MCTVKERKTAIKGARIPRDHNTGLSEKTIRFTSILSLIKETIKNTMNIEEITQQITDMVINYAPKFAQAIITLIIGMWVIKRLMNWVEPTINKSTKDETLSQFLASILSALLKVMLLLSVASMFGIDATSFIAVFGALMVGIGMALNGSIGHVACGVMLMIFKPFKVEDLVKIGGGQTTGTIESINAFNTVLATLDNK